jgi:hypothetical protein
VSAILYETDADRVIWSQRFDSPPPGGGRDAEVPWLVLIAVESENGQTAEARADLQKFLSTLRTCRSIAEVQKSPQLGGNSKLLAGLRLAGMPEE